MYLQPCSKKNYQTNFPSPPLALCRFQVVFLKKKIITDLLHASFFIWGVYCRDLWGLVLRSSRIVMDLDGILRESEGQIPLRIIFAITKIDSGSDWKFFTVIFLIKNSQKHYFKKVRLANTVNFFDEVSHFCWTILMLR